MHFQDRLAEEAFNEVAALFATAYQRYITTGCVLAESPTEPPENELDKSSPSSLHRQ